MKHIKSIIMITLLVCLTVSVSVAPIVFNAYADSMRLENSKQIKYDPYVKKRLSAVEFAIMYSKGIIANNSSLLNAVNEEIPETERVRKEVGEILEKVFEGDASLQKRVLTAIEAPMEHYGEDKILFVNDSYAMTFSMVNALFIDADAMLEICYEKSTGVVVFADYREFDKENKDLIDSCNKALWHYYCETMELNIDRYYFAPLIFNNDTWCQFGIHQGTMSDAQEKYYN